MFYATPATDAGYVMINQQIYQIPSSIT